MPRLIGITGGIGSGKTTVCKIFSALGVPVYNADERARYLMENSMQLKSSIIKLFGDSAYLIDGELNRSHISKVVFEDKQKLGALNQLVHPTVGNDFSEWVDQHVGHAYAIKEAAIMIGTRSAEILDKIIVVTAPDHLRIDRVLKRDNSRSRDQIEKIMGNQMSQQEMMAQADYIVKNDGTELILPFILTLHNQFVNDYTNS